MTSLDLTAAYLLGVGVLGICLAMWVLYLLRRSEKGRKRELQKRRFMDAVRTASPIDQPSELARERGFESIQARFTVVRATLIPLIVVIVALLMSLPYLSMVPAAALSAVVAILTVTVGIAARPFLENAISGLTISFSRLFRIGDTVNVDGWYGTIEDISMTHTTVKVWDWRRYIVPNSQMLAAKFLNYSLYDRYLWVSVDFWVAYEANLRDVRDIAVSAPKQSQYFASHEDARFWIMEMGKEAIQCRVAAWADRPSDGWMLGHDVRAELVQAFSERGIATHGFRTSMTDRRHSFPADADRQAAE